MAAGNGKPVCKLVDRYNCIPCTFVKKGIDVPVISSNCGVPVCKLVDRYNCIPGSFVKKVLMYLVLYLVFPQIVVYLCVNSSIGITVFLVLLSKKV